MGKQNKSAERNGDHRSHLSPGLQARLERSDRRAKLREALDQSMNNPNRPGIVAQEAARLSVVRHFSGI